MWSHQDDIVTNIKTVGYKVLNPITGRLEKVKVVVCVDNNIINNIRVIVFILHISSIEETIKHVSRQISTDMIIEPGGPNSDHQ